MENRASDRASRLGMEVQSSTLNDAAKPVKLAAVRAGKATASLGRAGKATASLQQAGRVELQQEKAPKPQIMTLSGRKVVKRVI